MGVEGLSIAVIDTEPLTHLDQIDGLSVLQAFEKIYLPNEVWSEAVEKGGHSAERWPRPST